MYTLDTNALIYYLDGEPAVVALFEQFLAERIPLYISAITELELFSYPALTTEGESEIEEALAGLRIVPVASRIARIAGDLRRLYRLATPDAAIAATAIFTNTHLVTRNVRDFNMIEGLPVRTI